MLHVITSGKSTCFSEFITHLLLLECRYWENWPCMHAFIHVRTCTYVWMCMRSSKHVKCREIDPIKIFWSILNAFDTTPKDGLADVLIAMTCVVKSLKRVDVPFSTTSGSIENKT